MADAQLQLISIAILSAIGSSTKLADIMTFVWPDQDNVIWAVALETVTLFRDNGVSCGDLSSFEEDSISVLICLISK